MRSLTSGLVALMVLALTPAAAGAQGLLTVTPKVGGYFQSESVRQIADGAATVQQTGSTTFAWGVNVGVGIPGSPLDLRGDLSVATGATVSQEGIQDGNGGDIDASLLAASADLVLRPLSFLPLVDPYLLGGAGFTNTSFESGAGIGGLDDVEDEREFALHAGIGTDVVLGGVSLQVEATDYISGLGSDGDTVHHVFGTVGLGISLF